jgi:hypothetical protein
MFCEYITFFRTLFLEIWNCPLSVIFKQGNTVKRSNWQNVERKISRFAFSVHFRRFEGSGLRLNKLQDHHKTVPARSVDSIQLLWGFWDITGLEDSSGVELNKLGVAMLWGETAGISVSLTRGIVHISHISEVSNNGRNSLLIFKADLLKQ